MNLEELRQKIVKKYGSIHNFCKLNENLTRATVYLVFAEKYAGNTQKQLARIEKTLDNSEDVPKKNNNRRTRSFRSFTANKMQ
mgnify:FL=1